MRKTTALLSEVQNCPTLHQSHHHAGILPSKKELEDCPVLKPLSSGGLTRYRQGKEDKQNSATPDGFMTAPSYIAKHHFASASSAQPPPVGYEPSLPLPSRGTEVGTRLMEESREQTVRNRKRQKLCSQKSSSSASAAAPSPAPVVDERLEKKRRINRLSAQRKRLREKTLIDTLTAQKEHLNHLNQSVGDENLRIEKLVNSIVKLRNSDVLQRYYRRQPNESKPSSHPEGELCRALQEESRLMAEAKNLMSTTSPEGMMILSNPNESHRKSFQSPLPIMPSSSLPQQSFSTAATECRSQPMLQPPVSTTSVNGTVIGATATADSVTQGTTPTNANAPPVCWPQTYYKQLMTTAPNKLPSVPAIGNGLPDQPQQCHLHQPTTGTVTTWTTVDPRPLAAAPYHQPPSGSQQNNEVCAPPSLYCPHISDQQHLGASQHQHHLAAINAANPICMHQQQQQPGAPQQQQLPHPGAPYHQQIQGGQNHLLLQTTQHGSSLCPQAGITTLGQRGIDGHPTSTIGAQDGTPGIFGDGCQPSFAAKDGFSNPKPEQAVTATAGRGSSSMIVVPAPGTSVTPAPGAPAGTWYWNHTAFPAGATFPDSNAMGCGTAARAFQLPQPLPPSPFKDCYNLPSSQPLNTPRSGAVSLSPRRVVLPPFPMQPPSPTEQNTRSSLSSSSSSSSSSLAQQQNCSLAVLGSAATIAAPANTHVAVTTTATSTSTTVSPIARRNNNMTTINNKTINNIVDINNVLDVPLPANKLQLPLSQPPLSIPPLPPPPPPMLEPPSPAAVLPPQPNPLWCLTGRCDGLDHHHHHHQQQQQKQQIYQKQHYGFVPTQQFAGIGPCNNNNGEAVGVGCTNGYQHQQQQQHQPVVQLNHHHSHVDMNPNQSSIMYSTSSSLTTTTVQQQQQQNQQQQQQQQQNQHHCLNCGSCVVCGYDTTTATTAPSVFGCSHELMSNSPTAAALL